MSNQISASEAGDPACAWPRHPLRYRLLGPVEIVRDGEPCTPSALKLRALLAVFLLHANEALAADRLIDELWRCAPPRSAAATLQAYISALRRILDPAHGRAGRHPRQHPVLQTHPSGYLLAVKPGELDLHRFRALAALGRDRLADGRCGQAGEMFGRALVLWRGPALSDLSRADLMAHYTTRLEEERLALLHERIAADVCCGRGSAVVVELQELCARHPLRETIHEQLMLALCAAGRRAEALDAYARARRILVDDVGVEPGPALRAAQQAVLEGREPRNGAHLHPAGQRTLALATATTRRSPG